MDLACWGEGEGCTDIPSSPQELDQTICTNDYHHKKIFLNENEKMNIIVSNYNYVLSNTNLIMIKRTISHYSSTL